MARNYEIKPAFMQAIKIASNGRRTVTTQDFLEELRRVNWFWSPREANQWIETYTHNFKDASTVEGENKTWEQFNPNGGI